MSKCTVCQHSNEEGSEYCEECGVKLEATSAEEPSEPVVEAVPAGPAAPVEMPTVVPSGGPDGDDAGEIPAFSLSEKLCPGCEATVDAAAVFCSQCGARLTPSRAGEAIRLKMISGRHKDRLYETPRNELFIGRLPENDIPLETDAYVSSRHTRVFREGPDTFVEDLGSTNGTFVKVRKQTRLEPGDEIKVGQSIFKLEE